MRRTLPLFVLLLTLASIHSTSQQRKVIRDPTEYKAYMSALSLDNDPQKAAAMEAFIARYPSSVMKVDALAVAMDCYRRLYEVDKVEKTGLRILELDPNHIRALTILTGLNHAWATAAGDPQQAARFSPSAPIGGFFQWSSARMIFAGHSADQATGFFFRQHSKRTSPATTTRSSGPAFMNSAIRGMRPSSSRISGWHGCRGLRQESSSNQPTGRNPTNSPFSMVWQPCKKSQKN
jgi:hypothetical protein